MAFVSRFLRCCRSLNSSQTIKLNFLPAQNVLRAQYIHVEVNEKVQARLRRKDELSDDYKIIYRAPYETYCKVAYSVTIFSSTIFPALFTSLLWTQGVDNYPLMLNDIELVGSSSDILVFIGGLMIIIAQLSLVIFRYPFRIYRNTCNNDYILIYQHLLPWQNEKVPLKAGELKVCTKALFTWGDALYEFRKAKRKAILFDHCFHKPLDLEEMLGRNKKIEGDSK